MTRVQGAWPAGVCDCHTHVVGDTTRYPMVSDRHYTPGLATHDDLLAHMQRTGIQRVVIVQPSFYGSDNRCMMDSLARLGDAGRGVAVLDEGADDALLAQLHAGGVRGLRLNVESAGVQDVRVVEKPLRYWSARLAPLGWHLQMYASLQTLVSLAPMLPTLAVPVVLDHFALVPAGTPVADARFRALLDVLASDRVYVKLSAPYRVAKQDEVQSSLSVAQAFLQANPARILWGSDWPHTNREPGKSAHQVSRYRDIASATLRAGMDTWLPTAELKAQVLVNNPARLYDFPESLG
jgi:predicted TIM-barrel fold metal-dependent hydrolase